FALALPSTLLASPAAAAPEVAQRYAACLAQSHPDKARDMLQASPGAASSYYLAMLDDNRCLSQAFGDRPFSPDDDALSQPMLRGNLAEQLLLKQLAQVAAVQPLPLQQ